MAYDAFISYSHAADGRLAPALQTGLQRLARPWYRRRALRVFRDDTGLAVNPHLWASIAAALDDSACFVLLASPEAAASPWVNREIEHFCTHDRDRPILPVLTEGTLVWDDAQGDYHSMTSSALPPALVGRFADEPRHLDLRWARDEAQLDVRHSRFREAVADLAAPMHHLPKDELESEDIRQHRRALRLARAAAVTLVVLLMGALVTGVVAVRNARRADRSTREAQAEATVALSRQLAATSANALNDGRPDVAMLLAVAANRTQSNTQTRGALLGALLTQPASLRKYLNGLDRPAGAMTFDVTGRRLAVSDNRKVRIWDVASGQLLTHQPVELPIGTSVGASLQLSADGSMLAAAVAVDPGPNEKRGIRVWDLRTDKILRSVDLGTATPSFALSSNGSMLAVGGDMIDLWSLDTGTRVRALPVTAPSPAFMPPALAFSPDGTSLAVATASNVAPGQSQPVIQRWDIASGTEIGTPVRAAPCACALEVQEVSFGLDGKQLRATAFDSALRFLAGAPGGIDGWIVDWGVDSGKRTDIRHRLTTTQDEPVVAVSRNGLAATRSASGAVQIRDTTTGALVGEPLVVPSVIVMGARSPAIFSPDGTILAVGGTDGPVRLYDVKRAEPRLGRRLPIDMSSVAAVAVSPDGHTLAVGHADGTVVLLNARSGLAVASQTRLGSPGLARLSFIANGGKLAAVTPNGMVSVWDVESSKKVDVPFGPEPPCGSGQIFGPTFSAGSEIVVLACLSFDQDLERFHFTVWNVALHRVEARWDVTSTGTLDVLALSDDGRLLALGFRGAVQLVDTRSGKTLRPELEPGLSYLGPLAFSPGGSTLAGIGVEGIQLWDRATGRRRAPPFKPSVSSQTSLAFSPDGLLVATGSSDGTLQLWDVRTVTRFGQPLLGRGHIELVAFAANGRTVVTRSERELVEWDLDPSSWIRTACGIVNRDLARTEWELYAGSTVRYRHSCG